MTVIPLVVSLLITGIASTEVRADRPNGRTHVRVFVALLVVTALDLIPAASRLRDAARTGPSPAAPRARPPRRDSSWSRPAPASRLGSRRSSRKSQLPAAPSAAMLPLILFTLLLRARDHAKPGPRRADGSWILRGPERRDAAARALGGRARASRCVRAAPAARGARRGRVGRSGGGLYVVFYSIGRTSSSSVYPVVSIAGGVPIRRFARAVLPAQLIAFSTSSSIASLPALVEGAERDLELDSSVTGFVLPLAVSTLSPPLRVLDRRALFVARFYGIPLHTAPAGDDRVRQRVPGVRGAGIPRGAFLMLAPLFLAIGLPVEGIGILIAVDAIPDMFATVLNATGDLLATVLVPGRCAARRPRYRRMPRRAPSPRLPFVSALCFLRSTSAPTAIRRTRGSPRAAPATAG